MVDGKLIWRGLITSYEMSRERIEGPPIEDVRTFSPAPTLSIDVKTKE